MPVKVVSERLGHASATITLTVYQHVHPGMGREAADRFAASPGFLTCRNPGAVLCPRGDSDPPSHAHGR